MKKQKSLRVTLFLSLPFLLIPLLIANSPKTYDVVILNGQIVDGTGNPWFLGDIAIRNDRIARIAPAGQLKDLGAKERINAHGLVVAPGFIDIQSHSRGAFLLGDGRVISKVTQGITTEILGEGWTDAPVNEKILATYGDIPQEIKKLAMTFTGPRGFNNWLEAMQKHGISANVGSFLGAATVRIYVKGEAMGSPTNEEIKEMQQLVRNAMEDGAFGIASALIYPPGSFAATKELIAMSEAMVPYGGVYITHLRSEADKFLEGLDEAITIGRKAGVPVEVYHLKAAGRRNWHKAELAIARIEAARDEGLDIGADMYPYIAGSTGLAACLPPWASADGKLLENLKDPEIRAKIKQDILHPKTEWENLGALATPEGIMILGLYKPENKKYTGQRLAEIASDMGKDWIDTIIDLILSEQQGIGTIYFMMTDDNLKLQMQQPWIKFGTDASGEDPEKPQGLVHPRSYGTYPRILGKYVREDRTMKLEEAIRKMSSAVTNRLFIKDRGLIREGYYADVVIFDQKTIGDRATFDNPHQVSVGVHHVFVNGTAVVKNGQHTDAKPGKIVRGPGYIKQ
ncbi:MAG: D-aminoacylase [Candidatus Aminicenantes bacterium]|nr:MAG: D-aminoacylase [Candidatus Aminicenantes bacterium]